MSTIQIEADVSAEQLLQAVEQLPPREFTAFIAQLLARARAAARSESMPTSSGGDKGTTTQPAVQNPYLAAAGMFSDDSFASEIEALLVTRRAQEREEAARAADA